MSEVWFYHLQRSTLETALPPLLERCLQRGWRALVCGGLAERLEQLDDTLWAYRDDAFLPHGLEGRDPPEVQPILLTAGAANLNGAKIAFLIDGVPLPALDAFERVCVVFDGRDENAVRRARAQWTEAKAQAGATYWRESEEGRWERVQ